LLCSGALPCTHHIFHIHLHSLFPVSCSGDTREERREKKQHPAVGVAEARRYVKINSTQVKKRPVQVTSLLCFLALLFTLHPFHSLSLSRGSVVCSDECLCLSVSDECLCLSVFARSLSLLQFPLKLQHPQNSPNRETQISRYRMVQIQIEILISSDCVSQKPRFTSLFEIRRPISDRTSPKIEIDVQFEIGQ